MASGEGVCMLILPLDTQKDRGAGPESYTDMVDIEINNSSPVIKIIRTLIAITQTNDLIDMLDFLSIYNYKPKK